MLAAIVGFVHLIAGFDDRGLARGVAALLDTPTAADRPPTIWALTMLDPNLPKTSADPARCHHLALAGAAPMLPIGLAGMALAGAGCGLGDVAG